jgi:hypothetical protein
MGGTHMNFKKTVAIAAAAGALTALAIPAMAETSLYGSARVAVFENVQVTTPGNVNSGADEHLQNNSRFGAIVNNGDVSGRFELGMGESTLTGSNTITGASVANSKFVDPLYVRVRLMYGTWNFGAGKLTVGQDYNSYYLLSAQVFADDNANNGFGALWDARQAQIRVNMNNGLYAALIQPSVGNSSGPDYGTLNGQTESGGIKIYLPKINVGYKGEAGAVKYNVGVVGETFKNVALNETVNAYVGYVEGVAAFGNTGVQGVLSYGQNAGNLGFSKRMSYNYLDTKDNAHGFEGYVQGTQKFSNMVSANVGIGYDYDQSGHTGASVDDRVLFFANAPITLAKGVIITPEFDYQDELRTKDVYAQNRMYSVGAQFRIDF